MVSVDEQCDNSSSNSYHAATCRWSPPFPVARTRAGTRQSTCQTRARAGASGRFTYVSLVFKSPNRPSCSPPLFPSPPTATALARCFPSCRHIAASPCHVASRSWRPSSFVRLDIVSTSRRLLPSFLHFTADHLCSSVELAVVPTSLPNCSRNHGHLNMAHLLSQFVPALAARVARAPSSSSSTSRVPS
jgi:hypothetical protein